MIIWHELKNRKNVIEYLAICSFEIRISVLISAFQILSQSCVECEETYCMLLCL